MIGTVGYSVIVAGRELLRASCVNFGAGLEARRWCMFVDRLSGQASNEEPGLGLEMLDNSIWEK